MPEPTNNRIYDPSSFEMKLPENETIETEASVKQFSFSSVLLALLIVVLLIILGGLLWWGKLLLEDIEPAPAVTATRPTAEENNEPESTTAEAEVSVLEAQSPSDDLAAIEADLLGTDLDSIERELENLNQIFETMDW